MYNVGPDFTRPSTAKDTCPDCGDSVRPEWDGAEGEFRSPCCYAPMPDHVEGEG